MNKAFFLIPLALVVIVAIAVSALRLGPKDSADTNQPTANQPTATDTSNPTAVDSGNQEAKKELIVVDVPKENAVIKSPLTIKGKARGNWYFEADFPVRLVDSTGKEIGRSTATAQGEWMTENFVPFTSTLSFNTSTAGRGTLILEKNNPSGLAENADELRIPVSWGATSTRAIQLFYYNKTKDPNTTCESSAVLPVSRSIPSTVTPIQDTIKQLLRGELTTTEANLGFDTEFPLPGVELKGAVIRDGTLTLEFTDPQNKLSGGSCRVGILRAEVEKTAKQFPEVKSVRFIPETLFQP